MIRPLSVLFLSLVSATSSGGRTPSDATEGDALFVSQTVASEAPMNVAQPAGKDPFERLSLDAHLALLRARIAVSTYGGTRLEAEHLLLAIVQEWPNRLDQFTRSGKLTSPERELIEAITTVRKPAEGDEVLSGPGLVRALSRADTAATDHPEILVEHLVLGLLDDRGRAGQLLRNGDTDRDKIIAYLKSHPTRSSDRF